jgi:hypothetical protein
MNTRLAAVLAVTFALAAVTAATAGAAGPVLPTCTNTSVTCKVGSTPDGSTWKIEVPHDWNGTLLLYSHGYVPPTTPTGQPATNPPADDFQDRQAADYLLAHGFALAGSSYTNVGCRTRSPWFTSSDATSESPRALSPGVTRWAA